MRDGDRNGGGAGTPRLLRTINDRAALDLLLDRGPLSRGELGALTGLSKPTSSQLLARLEQAGLVEPAPDTAAGGEEDAGRRKPGRAAQLYRLRAGAGHAGGVDVTRRRVRAAVADLTGRVLGTARIPVPARTKDGALERVGEALDAALAGTGLDRGALDHVTVGTPGMFDPATGLLRYAPNLAGWHAPDTMDRVRELLGTATGFENDVNLAAVAAQRTGATRGAADFVLFWAGEDGLGCASVLGGRLHRGATGGAGEIGYLWLPGNAVHGLAHNANGGFHELAGPPAVLALARGRGIAARTAAEALSGGDGGLLDAVAERFAAGLANIVAVVDPEVVVLDGEMAAAGGEGLRERLAARLRDVSISGPPVVAAEGAPAAGSPVAAGAVGASLELVRERVFAT